MAKPEWLYGIHTVQAVLKKHPERVLEMKLQEGRDDPRFEAILALVNTLGLPLQRVSKKSLCFCIHCNIESFF